MVGKRPTLLQALARTQAYCQGGKGEKVKDSSLGNRLAGTTFSQLISITHSFVLGRLLQYEGWQASDSGTDTNSSGEEEEEDHDEGIEMSDDGSDSEQSSESEPPAKKAKRGLKRDRLPSRCSSSLLPTTHALTTSKWLGPRDDAFAGESDGGLCVAVVKKRPCKSKALAGFKYCWVRTLHWVALRGESLMRGWCSIMPRLTPTRPLLGVSSSAMSTVVRSGYSLPTSLKMRQEMSQTMQLPLVSQPAISGD